MLGAEHELGKAGASVIRPGSEASLAPRGRAGHCLPTGTFLPGITTVFVCIRIPWNTEMETGPHKNLYRSVPSSIIHKTPKGERAEVFVD